MPAYFYLAVAIVSEVIATSALKASQGFSRPLPLLVVLAGYGLAFYCLSLTLRSIPLGVAYAVWSGVGIALITLVGWVVYKQALDIGAIIGIALIIIGAILTFAVEYDLAGIDIRVIGVILMIGGLVGMIVGLVVARRGRAVETRRVVDERDVI